MPKFLIFLGLGMSIFFIFMSVMIIVRPPDFFEGYSQTTRLIFAGLILAYGFFRLTRVVKELKKKRPDQNSG